VSIGTDTGVETIDVVDSVVRIGVGEGRATNVGVGFGIATGVVVAPGVGELITDPSKGVAIGDGVNAVATIAFSSAGLAQAAMIAITENHIIITLGFRLTSCSLRVALGAL